MGRGERAQASWPTPQRVLTRAPSRVKELVAITPVPASGSPFDDAGWALFSGAAENAANRVGEHDQAITADAMKTTYLAWYPNATLEVMKNAGHVPMHETPVALATTIERFLRA